MQQQFRLYVTRLPGQLKKLKKNKETLIGKKSFFRELFELKPQKLELSFVSNMPAGTLRIWWKPDLDVVKAIHEWTQMHEQQTFSTGKFAITQEDIVCEIDMYHFKEDGKPDRFFKLTNVFPASSVFPGSSCQDTTGLLTADFACVVTNKS